MVDVIRNRDKVCTISECDLAVYAKDFCRTHYGQQHQASSGVLCKGESNKPCPRPAVARGFCQMHWQRWNKYGSPDVIGTNKGRFHLEEIDCLQCGVRFRPPNKKRKYCSRDCYSKSKIRNTPFCTEPDCPNPAKTRNLCQKHYTRLLRKENGHKADPLYSRMRVLQGYHLTFETFEEMLANQDYHCALCPATEPGGSGAWHIDHDHSCCPGKKTCGRCTRGLLCSACNSGLGFFKDDISVMQAAIGYIESHQLRQLATIS